MSMTTELQNKIVALLPDVELRFNETMSAHTSFKIGGPAEIMALPKSADELAKILKVQEKDFLFLQFLPYQSHTIRAHTRNKPANLTKLIFLLSRFYHNFAKTQSYDRLHQR